MRILVVLGLLMASPVTLLTTPHEGFPELAVVVNAANPVKEVPIRTIREILLGSVREWPNHRRITIVQRESQNPTIAALLKIALGMSNRDYTRYLLQMEFKGDEPLQLKTLVSDEGACEFVHNAPGAIAFFYPSTLSSLSCGSQVRVIAITDKAARSTKVALH